MSRRIGGIVTRVGILTVALASGLIACQSAPKKASSSPEADVSSSESSGASSGPVAISLAYLVPSNELWILDCVSPWNRADSPGDCGDDGVYRKDWQKRFGHFSADDRAKLAAYAKFRADHYVDSDEPKAEKKSDEPAEEEKSASEKAREAREFRENPLKNPNGLFASRGAERADPVAEAVDTSATWDEAFTKLKSGLEAKDLGEFRDLVSHFAPKLALYDPDSSGLGEKAKQLAPLFRDPKYADFLAKIRQFYAISEPVDFQGRFVWWPAHAHRTLTSRRGRFLFLARNPGEPLPAEKLGEEESTVLRELVHEISSRQEAAQKQALTQSFLAGCNPWTTGYVKRPRVLEEPLAVAIGQMLFLDRFDPPTFQATRHWTHDGWVNLYAPKLFDILKPMFAAGPGQPAAKITDKAWLKAAIGECQKVF